MRLPRSINYEDFTGFLIAFKSVTERLRDPEDFELITYHLVEKLAAEGCLHAEVFVSVGVIFWRGQEFDPLFEGMERGRAARRKALAPRCIGSSTRFDTLAPKRPRRFWLRRLTSGPAKSDWHWHWRRRAHCRPRSFLSQVYAQAARAWFAAQRPCRRIGWCGFDQRCARCAEGRAV